MTTRLIKTSPLLTKLGGIARVTLDRKIAADPTFPKPVYMGRQRFFDVDAVEAWMAAQPTVHPTKRVA